LKFNFLNGVANSFGVVARKLNVAGGLVVVGTNQKERSDGWMGHVLSYPRQLVDS